MYTPSSFKEDNPEILLALIEHHNFGILFSQHKKEPEATHLPFLIERKKGEQGTLIAHFARANKHWQNIDKAREVLCIFQGPHTYISPSYYENRNTVPTWNYATVHVYGKPRVIQGSEELREMVTNLTHYHENHTDSNWSLDEVTNKYFEANLKAIVGIEIEITRMEGKFKFNQNKSKDDQKGVIKKMDELGNDAVSEIMKKNLRSGS